MIRILLIDHSHGPRSVRALLAGAETSNFKIHCVTTYRDTLNSFRRESCDVCLIDSVTDNGLKLFAQARSVNFTAPVVMVVSDSAKAAIKAMRSGVADCLIREELTLVQIERSICVVVEQARLTLLRNQRERRHLALIDNTREIVLTQDLDGNFTSMNGAGERLIGYSQTDVQSMKVGDVIAPEYRGRVAKMIERILDAQTQMVERVELFARDGARLPVELNMHPIQSQGRTIEIQIVACPSATGSKLMIERVKKNSQPRSYGLYDIHSLPDHAGTVSRPIFSH
jgi:PAS domain S-box-containing protein